MESVREGPPARPAQPFPRKPIPFTFPPWIVSVTPFGVLVTTHPERTPLYLKGFADDVVLEGEENLIKTATWLQLTVPRAAPLNLDDTEAAAGIAPTLAVAIATVATATASIFGRWNRWLVIETSRHADGPKELLRQDHHSAERNYIDEWPDLSIKFRRPSDRGARCGPARALMPGRSAQPPEKRAEEAGSPDQVKPRSGRS